MSTFIYFHQSCFTSARSAKFYSATCITVIPEVPSLPAHRRQYSCLKQLTPSGLPQFFFFQDPVADNMYIMVLFLHSDIRIHNPDSSPGLNIAGLFSRKTASPSAAKWHSSFVFHRVTPLQKTFLLLFMIPAGVRRRLRLFYTVSTPGTVKPATIVMRPVETIRVALSTLYASDQPRDIQKTFFRNQRLFRLLTVWHGFTLKVLR